MSHAFCIVALPASLNREEIEDAVTVQMAPFYEDGGWFEDGSRWDWWGIGGRYSGFLDGEDIK